MSNKSKRSKRRVVRGKSGKLIELLHKKPGLTAEEICSELGWSPKTVKNIITRLSKSGKIENKIFPCIGPRSFPSITRINQALEQIDLQFSKLESVKDGLKKKEKETFEKVVGDQMKNDTKLASIYANHCAQIRDLMNIVKRGELILKRLSLIFGRE